MNSHRKKKLELSTEADSLILGALGAGEDVDAVDDENASSSSSSGLIASPRAATKYSLSAVSSGALRSSSASSASISAICSDFDKFRRK